MILKTICFNVFILRTYSVFIYIFILIFYIRIL